MKHSKRSIPDSHSRLQAAWGLALPCVERVVVIAADPPEELLDWWRRQGTQVSVLQPQTSPGVPEVLPQASIDLLLLWDVAPGNLRSHLQRLEGVACRNLAVWRKKPGAFTALLWLMTSAGLRRRHWIREARIYAWPELQRPRQLIEHDHWTRTPVHVHRRSQKPWKTALLQSSIGRLRAPASLSRWRRSDASATPSLLQLIVGQASDRVGEALVAGDQRLSPNGVAIVRLQRRQDGQPLGILKVPLAERSLERVAINARALAWMQSQRPLLGNWSDASPRLLASENTHACPWTLEEHVVGSEAQTWEPAPARQATVHLAELLGRYHRSSAVSIDIGALQDRLQPQVDRLCALLDADLAQGLQEIWSNTVRNLEEVRIPVLPQHGDCKLENVLGDPRRPTQLRLLDWELWRPDGLPLLDLLHLLLSRRRRQAGYSIGGSICRWLLSWDFAPWEQRLIDTLAHGLDRQYVRAAPVLYWLERIGPNVERGEWPDAGWARANVEQVIERLQHRPAEVMA